MSTSDPGVPYGGGPEEAAADAEPTLAHEAAAPPKSPSGTTPPPPVSPPPAAGPDGPPLAIPGIPLDRPELHVAAAFAGGFVLALVLKRLAR